MSKAHILVVDDEAEIRESLETLLSLEGFQVDSADTAEGGQKLLEQRSYDVVLLDVALPGKSGLDALLDYRRLDPNISVLVLTAYGSVANAVAAIRNGAENFLTKPWDNEQLLAEIRSSIKRHRLTQENVQLKRALGQRYNFPNIVGKSDAMLKILDLVEQVAVSRSTVLLVGESGTGKEVIAKAIHLRSPRAQNSFVPVNTGSLPVDLLESTLFGHVKGAFTSAIATKKGLFEVADQGTIFLDEISTISPETQAKLLRVIQEREFMPVGSNETIKTDVRIIAATNLDLRKMVADGRFREDLFYRLNVITIALPPLRDRKEDIPALAGHFLAKYCEENQRPLRRFSPETMRALMDHDWAGNVRELENVVERAVVLSRDAVITPELLPENLSEGRARAFLPLSEAQAGASLFEIMDECERRIISDTLEKTSGSQTEAAERLQVPLSTLNQKIKRLSIEVKRRGRRENGVRETPTPA